jgi:hypothetical protein
MGKASGERYVAKETHLIVKFGWFVRDVPAARSDRCSAPAPVGVQPPCPLALGEASFPPRGFSRPFNPKASWTMLARFQPPDRARRFARALAAISFQPRITERIP